MNDIFQLASVRLLLRPVNINDAAAIFLYRSDSITNKYQGWIPGSLDDVIYFIHYRISPEFDVKGTWYQFAMILKESNELIGDIGVHFVDSENKQVELGCTINKKHHRNGYATESMTEVINYIFKNTDNHRITASVDPRNTGSIRLLEKLNFRKEAHFRESIFSDGSWTDDLIYAILMDEWAILQA